MRGQTCCFSGHRKMPVGKIQTIVERLNHEIDDLIRHGVTDFISGGAPGFDHIAAALVIAKKEMGQKIRLIFVLPCRNQDERWSDRQKQLYHSLLAEADKVVYVSEQYAVGCMKKRNKYMVDHSAYCICALLPPLNRTDQTVRYAWQKGLKVINVAK